MKRFEFGSKKLLSLKVLDVCGSLDADNDTIVGILVEEDAA